ncbi:uncharacterized protein [Venturia canescens]|uniref:uncharacterized protein n=1 Tax=Venturia canescens TaxID=32260 RepID=UPI001C9CB7CE|nr:uncharacterized protein LOC122419451 [Venturia canescens]
MSSSNLNDTAMTSSSGVTHDVNQVLRLTGVKTNSRYFSFRWKQHNSDEINASRNLDVKDLTSENLSNSKNTNGFLKSIKKRLHIKNLRVCKVKQKLIGVDSQQENVESQATANIEKTLSFPKEKDPTESSKRLASNESDILLPNDQLTSTSEAQRCWESYLIPENGCERENVLSSDHGSSRELTSQLDGLETDNDPKNENEINPLIMQAENIVEPQSTIVRESIETVDSIIDPQILNENKAKVNLSEELLKLSKYGWYWGPISGDEADSKLVSEPDGAFLVRDSSDDRYLLTLSFKSSGRLLHARMEHSGGLFSLCNQGDNKGFTSVAALIDHSMNSSQSAVFCYSRPKYPGYPSFPVRLTKPVSRFTQVRSLQYLCRFVIRQNTRLDNIHKLPLPKTIRGYIEEAHY